MPWGKRAASPFGRLPTASRSNLTRQLIFRPAHHVFGAARGRGACTFAGGSRRRAMWLVDFRGHPFFTSFFTSFFTTLFPVFHPPRISRTAHTCRIFGRGPVKIHIFSPSRGIVHTRFSIRFSPPVFPSITLLESLELPHRTRGDRAVGSSPSLNRFRSARLGRGSANAGERHVRGPRTEQPTRDATQIRSV